MKNRNFPRDIKSARSRVRGSILKTVANDFLNTPLKYDSRFALISFIAEAIAEERQDPDMNHELVRKSLYDVKKKGYIKEVVSKDKKTVRFEITRKGEEILRGYDFNDLTINTDRQWDKKWRFVLFDVPEKYRYARNVLRDKLKRLGFFQVQQSVWVFPHDCEEEIDFLAEFLHVKPYILFFTAPVKNDERLRSHFEKRGMLD